MLVRLLYVTGDPGKIDDAISAVTKKGRELLGEQPGYHGVVVLADRELGKLVVGSFWESEQLARASDEALREQRTQLVTPFAVSQSVELYEVLTVHQARRPEAGAATRLLRLEFDPATTDQFTEAFRGITGKLDPVPGFCRAVQFVDRQRGRAVIALTYADRAALAASRSAAAGLRAEVNQKAQAVATRSLEELDLILFDAPPS